MSDPSAPLVGESEPKPAAPVVLDPSAEIFEQKTRPLREQLDRDLAEVYASKAWADACAKVAAIRQKVNRADFGANDTAMPGLLEQHEAAKAERDTLLEYAHNTYHRRCEE